MELKSPGPGLHRLPLGCFPEARSVFLFWLGEGVGGFPLSCPNFTALLFYENFDLKKVNRLWGKVVIKIFFG